MGKGREKRKKKEQKLAPNKQAHEARLKRLAEQKSTKKTGNALPKAATEPSTSNKDSKANKKNKKKKAQEEEEDEEDIETILANIKKEQEEKFLITEEVGTDPPTPRASASLTANPLNPAELILFGGEFYNGQKCIFFNDLFRYNIDKKEWRRITSPNTPGPRSSHQAVATPTGSVFVFGGEFASASESQFFHYKDFWVLDLKTNAWEKLDINFKPSPRSGHRMVLWKNFLLLFGGFYDTVKETKYHDDLWAFDLNTYQWQKITVMENTPKPSPRSGFAMFVFNDVLFVYGGYCKVFVKGEKAKGIVHTDLWSIKLSVEMKNLRWEKRKRTGFAPSPRSGLSVTMHKNRAVLFGGVFDTDVTDEQMQSTFFNEMFLFQCESTRWYPLTLRAPKKPKQKQQKQKQTKVIKKPESDSDESDTEAEKTDLLREIEEDGDRDYNDNDIDSTQQTPRVNVVPVAVVNPANDQSTSSTSEPETKAEPTIVYPSPRFNAMVTTQRNTLFIYGGCVELEDREITMGDFYSLNLEKLDQFELLVEQPKEEYIASSSDDSDEDDDSEGESGDEDEDESDHSDHEQQNGESSSAPVLATEPVLNVLSTKIEPVIANLQSDQQKEKDNAVPTAAVIVAKEEEDLGTWEDLDEDGEEREERGGASSAAFQTSNIKLKSGGREQRAQLREQLQNENENAVPKFEESLADFYARTSEYWAREAYERTQTRGKELRRSGFELAKEKYEQMQPILKQMHELELLDSDDNKADGKGKSSKPATATRARR